MNKLLPLVTALLAAGCLGGTRDHREDGGVLPDGGTAGAEENAPFEPDGGYRYTDAGCITPASARALCGAASDDAICDLALGCSDTLDLDRCNNNCELNAKNACRREPSVRCLLDATDAGAQRGANTETCTALRACGWIF